MKAVRAIILFADIRGSTEFGYTQCLETHNKMLRDFHKTCREAIERFRQDNSLDPDRVTASCRGDECCVFLCGGDAAEDELLAMNLAIYLKEIWRQSDFCRLNWQAADTGLIPQVDLRIGIGSGEVALDHDVWSDAQTLEGIFISEAKRIEGQADAASDTLIMVKWDIREACTEAGVEVEFGPPIRLRAKGVPTVGEVPVYPVKTYGEWSAIQKKVVPSPKTYFDRLGHAEALRRSGDFEGAIRECDQLLELRPDDPDVLFNRAYALVDLRRYKEGLADYNRSLELRPDDPDTLNNRGIALRRLGRCEEALADYSRSLELRPDDPDTLGNRGLTLDELERYDEALADYNRALKLQPDHPNNLNLRGATLRNLGRYEEALADYDRSLQLRPDHPTVLTNRGVALRNLGRYEEALTEYNRALELRPDHPDALNNRGFALAKLGRLEEALADLDRALELQPEHAYILSTHALALAKAGQRAKAFSEFTRALALKPGEPGILYDRACAFAAASRWDESLRDLADAIAGAPQYRAVARKDMDLEALRSHREWGPKFWELIGKEEEPS